MRYNTVVTAALAPLRDGLLPRVTGPVYAKMADAGRDLVRSVGVSGVNVVRDGQEVRAHNPHTTLVYSMTLYDARLQDAMKQEADKFNAILPDGIQTTFMMSPSSRLVSPATCCARSTASAWKTARRSTWPPASRSSARA